MVDVFVVPVFHHGGSFVRTSDGTLIYQNGKVKKFPEMDLDFVNFGDLITLFKGLGYQSYNAVYWYDPTSADVESGLHILTGDAGINAMRENKMKNAQTNEFYLYFDHPVDEPEIVEDGGNKGKGKSPVLEEVQSSSSDDGYESTEDEPYKPPPPGFESESDDSAVDRVGKRKRVSKTKENIVSPSKASRNKPAAKKTGVKRNKRSWVKKGQNRGMGASEVKRRQQGRNEPNEKQAKTGPNEKQAKTGPNEQKPRGDIGQGPNEEPNRDAQPYKEGDVRFYVSGFQDDDDDPIYDYYSEDLHTPVSSEDESSKQIFPEFDDQYAFGEGRFELGTRFATIDRFKEVVKDSFIAEGRELRWIKNDRERVRVGCMDDECPYIVHLSYNKSLQCYQVKTYKNEHTCARDLGSNAADQHWISKKVEKRMTTQPHMRTNEAIDFLREEFSLTAHPKMVYRAVKEAREKIMGNEREQYNNVRDYLFEILRSNPGSRAELCVTPIPQSPPLFDRLYIGLEACKQGFKSGCRPLIHLDGCFLKTYYGGQLLTAVAQDANNQFYVVAYRVARSETKESWKWFLSLLQEDLGDVQTNGWNFMSDQQKGLLPALKEVMPNAHHRNCVMHIWKNFINRFKDLYIREVVWECAKCTTKPEFKEQMERLKGINQGAWEYLSKFEPATWVKAYFSHGPKVDNLTNNMCEVFNAKIVNYRSKHILTMCEEIRCYLMRRMVKHKDLLGNYTGKLAPVQQKRMERLIRPSNKWRADWTGDEERKRFEVSRKATKVAVDLISQTCSCNKWQLTGMPCIHAIAAIRKRHDHPEDYVHPWLCMESIHKTYAHCIQPVPSQEFWTRTEYSRPDPPIIKRPIGRPKVHNRQKDPAEPMMQQGEKLKRSFKVTCSKCGATGHNYKTCKGTPSDPNWKPKTKKAKKGSTSQALTVLPLSQSAPTDSDAPSTQDHSIPTQPPMPDVTPGPSNPVAATAVAPQVKPGPVTRRTHSRPPLQVPSTTHQNAQTTQSEMRPKQRIFRPPAPLNPSPLPPQRQPNPPGPHPPQVIPGPNAAATQETLAPTTTTTTGMFKFIPNPPSIVPKK